MRPKPTCEGGCHVSRESKRAVLGREFDEFLCPMCGMHPDDADPSDSKSDPVKP